jgi:hypothetical protein
MHSALHLPNFTPAYWFELELNDGLQMVVTETHADLVRPQPSGYVAQTMPPFQVHVVVATSC